MLIDKLYASSLVRCWVVDESNVLVAKLALRMHHVTWRGGMDHLKPHICNQRPQFAYPLYNFYAATMTIEGSLHGASYDAKSFSAVTFLSRQNRAPEIAVLGNNVI